jgi:hypothetical protein
MNSARGFRAFTAGYVRIVSAIGARFNKRVSQVYTGPSNVGKWLSQIGTITPGKEADIIVPATDRINVFPLTNAPGSHFSGKRVIPPSG